MFELLKNFYLCDFVVMMGDYFKWVYFVFDVVGFIYVVMIGLDVFELKECVVYICDVLNCFLFSDLENVIEVMLVSLYLDDSVEFLLVGMDVDGI